MTGRGLHGLGVDRLLAVCAHPDDESFGLGAVMSTAVDEGILVGVVCLTRGEASTLGADLAGLAERRATELGAAVTVLGATLLHLGTHPDGALTTVPIETLEDEVSDQVARFLPDCLLVFDEGGVTGHPDHQQATRAAIAVGERQGLPVLAWTLTDDIATQLNNEFAATFVGRSDNEIDLILEVDRTRQYEAIACHTSQSTDNPVLKRRLQLQGNRETLRWIRPPAGRAIR